MRRGSRNTRSRLADLGAFRHRERLMRTLLLAYAASGAISLGYQVVWLRHFVDRFGSSTFTFVLVISCFIVGLGAGALASRRLADALQKRLRGADELVLYGWLELLIPACVAFLFLERLVPADVVGSFPYALSDGIYEPTLALHLARVPLAVASVFVPCFFMGATYPLLCRAFADQAGFPARLYAWNTLGACTGVLASEMLLLRFLGTHTTLWVLLVANLVLGAYFVVRGSALLERARREPRPRAAAPVAEPKSAASAIAPTLSLGVLVAGSIVSGFLSGALEADAFRRVHFIQISNSAAMAFVSFWAIAAIFLASTLVHRRPGWRLGHMKIALFVGLALHLLLANVLLLPLQEKVVELASGAAGRFAFDPDGIAQNLGLVFAATGWLVFAPYFCTALLLPYLCNVAQAQGRHLGVLYGLNMLAFLLGMVVYSWVAPLVNFFYAFKLCAAAFFVLALFVASMKASERLRAWRVGFVSAGLAAAAWLTPAHFDHDYFSPQNPLAGAQIRALRGSAGLTSFIATTPASEALYLDAVRMSDTGIRGKRYMKIMAHFPLLAQAAPRSALLICFGVGNSAAALGKHSSLERIDIVDLSRNVLETAPEFAFHNDAIYDDPRVRRIHDDGRSFLALSADRYDLITSEPPPPLSHGISRLYSAEYYREVREHLTPRGCMTQWLPIYQMPPRAGELIVRTFVQAFPHVLLMTGHGAELLLVGSSNPIDLANVSKRFRLEESVRGDLCDIGVPTARHLLARILMVDAQLRRGFGTGAVISDETNRLSAYLPLGRQLVFPLVPRDVLAGMPADLLAAEPSLRDTWTDVRWLIRTVPDFPTRSLEGASTARGFVAGTDIDWTLIERLNQGIDHMRATQQPGPAASFAARSLEVFPDQLELIEAQGLRLASAQDPEAALAWLKRSAETFPEYPRTHFLLAACLASLRREAEARTAVEQALSIHPRYFEARVLLGDLLARQGDIPAARREYRTAMELKPMAQWLRTRLKREGQ